MIDTSRHYLKLSIKKKFLDAMSYGKFNVLHKKIVDDQSFPFVSDKFQKKSGQGSYNNKTHKKNQDDVNKVIEYARLRKKRVVPEFDTPGHTFSWRKKKNLLTKCYKDGKPDEKKSLSLGPIDPKKNANYDFLKTFFTEIAQRYPDKYMHLGGDEVPFGCWQSNPVITAWMKSHGIAGNYSLLEQYYEQKLLNKKNSLGKEYIIWQEVVDNNVKVLPDTVVNVWKGGWQAEMAKVTGTFGLKEKKSSCWYLNYISYGLEKKKYYQCEPTEKNGTDAQKELVIGGTGKKWGEWVDGTNILPRTKKMPRAKKIAERLWSSKETTDLEKNGMRIWEHRCRYLRRGIQKKNAIQSKYCRHEWPLD
ncbi:beta-hexosaminidase subunit beta [Exaiptasia diaphana]|uniref:beta-N-acetylhexosaminidase n=1 Tax=Exaiptasia diaphana TaxID=2652724 RepID=A0A913YGA7_EXADI|nr:beta-hexosaminidase subunit beta [Exaiptasia diaphana]